MSRRSFATKLKHLGFSKDVSPGIGRDPLIYTRVVRNTVQELRVVDVQLWRSGMSRASNMLNGCGDTRPTEFDSLDTMLEAIDHETNRTDHPRKRVRRRFHYVPAK